VAHSHNPSAASLTLRALACLGVWAALLGATHAAPAGETESALILKIGKFVRWPEAAFPSAAQGTLQLCIAGGTDDDAALDELNGRKLQERIIAVTHLASNDEISGCQILFVSRSESGRVAQILTPLMYRPVLTVSDMEGFITQGGMVGIKAGSGKTSFVINRPASSRAGLTIGAQLMQIAAAGTQGGKR
jgi:hypothetical protein